MSIKLSQFLPDTNSIDWNNPQSIKDWIIQAGLCIDELVRKAQSIQDTVMSSEPVASNFEVNNEKILYESGATRREYTLVNGSPRYVALT